jgi:pyruvate/2-oxoglutarate dehydrogenase complex dihydrolipoamide dehydrogenase (E3) component
MSTLDLLLARGLLPDPVVRAGIRHHDSAARFRDLGVDVFLGEGRFVDGSTIAVGTARLRFKRAVIATGAAPTHSARPRRTV